MQLHSNFRTVAPVVGWVNHVFGPLIQPVPDAQPPFRALSPVRPAAPGTGPAVTIVGAEPTTTSPGPTTCASGKRPASPPPSPPRCATAGSSPATAPPATSSGDRPVPATSPSSCRHAPRWPPSSRPSTASACPYRAESSSLVYATPEVRALLMAARAIDDPTDELAVVSTLRSPLFGCSDPDLFGWVQRGGPWSPVAPLPPPCPTGPTRCTTP